MATQTQVKEFINQIAPKAQEAYKNIGKVKPSICIGMACVECGYGTAGSVKHHSYLGHKVGSGKTATKYWDGTFFTSKTKEEYTVGVHTVISSAFRSFKDMQQCVNNFYELLNTSLYAKVLADSDYSEQMQQIKKCGYMTSSTEVNSVLSIIKKYDLTQYDVCMTGAELTAASQNPYKEPAVNICAGSSGPVVKWIQYELNQKGYQLAIDGIFGQKTLEAVKEFQESCGLRVDGIVGALTRQALKK